MRQNLTLQRNTKDIIKDLNDLEQENVIMNEEMK